MEYPAQITIVDPRPHDYTALSPWLASGEFQIQFLPDGRSALRSSRQEPSMLWMINVQLADWSGFDLFEMISPTVDCPIFLVADEYDSNQELRALALGVAKYLCKPLDFHWIDQIRRVPPASKSPPVPPGGGAPLTNRSRSSAERDRGRRPASADG